MPQQYSFPPPPPGSASPNQHGNQYLYGQHPTHYQQHQLRGGGSHRGGRGGIQNGRGEFHGAPAYGSHQNSGYDPRHPQPGPAQGLPAGFNGSNPQSVPTSYIGPQAGPPIQQGSGGPGYAAPHWQNQHTLQHGPSQQLAQQPMHHPHPSPLPVQSYHPNYAPQAYPSQYGPPQPTQFQVQVPSYTQNMPQNQPSHVAPSPIPPQQWQGSSQQNRQSFNNNRGRNNINSNGRSFHDSPAPLMGPPIRMGFDNERGGSHSTQPGNSFHLPPSNHHSPVPFPQPPYHVYPPQEFAHVSQRSPIDSVPYNPPQRGRGSGNTNYRGKGRADYQQHQFRTRHQQNSAVKPDNHYKSAGGEVGGKKKKKRRTNTLGLTPSGVDHEDSEEEVDDVDEEARLVTLLGPDTPQLPTDLEAWLAERKSRFPTKARREAAAEQLRIRREQNRESKLKKDNDKIVRKEEGETKLEKQQRRAEKLRLELEKAERKIQQEISGSKRKRENGDEGDDDHGQVSDDDADGLSTSDSDDKPESLPLRNGGPSRLPPTPKAQLQRHCKYFSTGGTCGKKGKCRFVHDQEVRNQALRDKEANGGKMTLAQRLILNDTAKDDLTILKSIKYLKEKGLMPEQLTASASRYEDDDESHKNGTENPLPENLVKTEC